MKRVHPIIEELREQARNLARKRSSFGREKNLKSRIFKPEVLGDTEADWTGAIGEVAFSTYYPVTLDQTFTQSLDCSWLKKADFRIGKLKVELKTKRIPQNAITYLLNRDIHLARGKNFDLYVLSTIDDSPNTAKEWAVLGWIPSSHITAYSISANPRVSSPAYDIPLYDLIDINRLFDKEPIK
jgi:hypothetical protein